MPPIPLNPDPSNARVFHDPSCDKQRRLYGKTLWQGESGGYQITLRGIVDLDGDRVYAVGYGYDIKDEMDYAEAAECLGNCILHLNHIEGVTEWATSTP